LRRCRTTLCFIKESGHTFIRESGHTAVCWPGFAALYKILGVRQRHDVAELTVPLKGFHGVCSGPETDEFFLTRALSIAGGSAQVLLSLVAERLLELPR
jgi:hypothetical protein